MSERTLIHAANSSENFNVYATDEVEVIYADGVGRINLGTAVSRLELYGVESSKLGEGANTVGSPGQPSEERVLTHVIVMPTRALISMINLTVRIMKANQQLLAEASATEAEQLQGILNSIQVVDAS